MRDGRWAKKQSFSRNDRGVSEIIGDILLVSIAVVMVGAMAVQMGSIDQPRDRPMVDLAASYDGVNITLTHMGGDELRNDSVKIYLFTNGTFNRTLFITSGRPSDAQWTLGEIWNYSFVTGALSQVRLQVLETGAGVVLLDKMLQRGNEAALLPDLGIIAHNISILKNGNPVDAVNNTVMTGDTVTVNATIDNYGGVGAPNVLVRMADYSTLDKRTYSVGNSTLPWIGAGASVNVTLNWTVPSGSWGPHTMSVKIIPLSNESRFANNYASLDWRVGYTFVITSPTAPVLTVRSIEFSKDHPIHGTSIMITARISNQGGVPAFATVRYFDNNNGTLIGIDNGLGVPVGGESISSIIWKASPGGLHNIIVNATDPNGTGHEAQRGIEVLPTILLVDDDRAGEGGLRDVISPMRGALESVGASYTQHYVSGGDGPLYDGGEHPLRDYDLVIWMTGFEASNTLTAVDQASLGRYLDKCGKLWLIGQDIVSDLGLGNAFLNNKMQVSSLTPVFWLNLATPDPVAGGDVLTGSEFNVTAPFPVGIPDQCDFVQASASAKPAFTEKGGGLRPVGLLFNATTNGSLPNQTYMASLFSFELTKIKRSNDRSLITYAMLEWFNCSARWGRDVSISDQEFNLTMPSFMDEVNITVFVRNNGLTDEPPDNLNKVLQVGFYVDGLIFDPASITIDDKGTVWKFDQPTSEIFIPQDTPNPNMHIDARGGFIKVSMVWVANKIGAHTLTVKVDPFDYIEEINEYNNKVSSSLVNEILYVRYGVLLVDDDDSVNNRVGSTNYNATYNISRAMNRLGYDYDLYAVAGTATDGPGSAKMEMYNAIIWCSGQSADVLTANDKTNLTAFLKKGDGRYLWAIGQDLIPSGDYTGATDPFFRDYLRVGNMADPGAPRTNASIEGAYLDPVAHGMRYRATPTFTDSASALVPYIDGRGIIYQKPMGGDLANEMTYEDAQDGAYSDWVTRITPVGTVNTISNVYESTKGSAVISLNRTGASAQNSSFMIGDYSAGVNWNVNDLPWTQMDRFTAQWSFRFGMNYTFAWHLTDTAAAHHTIYYTDTDANTGGADPVFGLGSWTGDNQWHFATRDLLRDLRTGTGNAALNISRVDGFEVLMNTGQGYVDDITLSRPFNSIRYENPTYQFKTVFTAWDPSYISYTGNDNYSAELAFMVMRWFDMYDNRPELRVSHLDLYYGDLTPLRGMKPMMGESYVLKALIYNPGGARGDAVVRFSDGDTVIDSVSLSVDADGRALAEIVWTPLFAGSRVLSASVDPDGIVPEIFEFNNIASMAIQTYFFYDDMEQGTKNWLHDATLARINGEAPLDYFSGGSVNTSIVSQWETLYGVNRTTSKYRSYNSSYEMIVPSVKDYTYSFYLTYDHTTNRQGYYLVAIQTDCPYIVYYFNPVTLGWVTLYTGTLAKGEIAVYMDQTAGRLYKIHSFGPLLVVITSSEGSNVNVANVDDGMAVGRNFTVMGDVLNRMGLSRMVAFATEDGTDVSFRYYSFTAPATRGLQIGATDTKVGMARGERYTSVRASGGAPNMQVIVNSTKPIMLYRLSGDNDELDSAMSTAGYTYGRQFYWPMMTGGCPWRILVTNLEDTTAYVSINETTALTGAYNLWNTAGDILPHTARLFTRAATADGVPIFFNLTANKNVTVLGGYEWPGPGDLFSNDMPWRGFMADSVWDYHPINNNPDTYKFSSPNVFANRASSTVLRDVYQQWSFGGPITIDCTPGIPTLGSVNAVAQGGLRYLADVGMTLTMMATGNVNVGTNQWQLDNNGWNNFNFDAGNRFSIRIPAGEHTIQFKCTYGVGGGAVKVVRVNSDAGGEFIWQTWAPGGGPCIGDDPATAFSEATSYFQDGHYWNYTGNRRFLYLAGGSGNCWIHTILPFEGAVETPGIMRSDGRAKEESAPAGGRAINEDYYAVTKSFSLVGYESAELSFYHKYALQFGANGIVIQVGNDTAGNGIYRYQYVTPKRPYTGNIRFDVKGAKVTDDFNNEMRWCFNGISSNGIGGWDYITVDLAGFIGRPNVRVKFLYINATMTRAGWWYLDDVTVRAQRSNSVSPTATHQDQWELVTKGATLGTGGDTADAYSGRKSWLCHESSAGVDYIRGGIDNSLMTVPIDLTNALDARLDCRLKFNINASDGRPPDGFRVEVSGNNGETWRAINRGVRSAWKVSGTEAAGADGTSATGVNAGNNWVYSATLSRLNCDLSGWAGSVILLRFRVVTRTDIATHYESAGTGFGGVYVDDVMVVGNTTTGRTGGSANGRTAHEEPGNAPPASGNADAPLKAADASGQYDRCRNLPTMAAAPVRATFRKGWW